MRRILLSLVAFSFLMGCTNDLHDSATANCGQEEVVDEGGVVRFKLFPTQNMWTYIKLDTQTGRMWQVQYSLNGDKGRFECDLNPSSLVAVGSKINGRFELYPTQNIYNFILLDQVEGKTWQVQWSFEEENRAVMPISK